MSVLNIFSAPFACLLTLLAFVLFVPSEALAHCDGMDGPVVKAAQKALETGDVNLVLIWIPQKNEAEIKQAFEKTLVVRKLSPEARQLADMYFFETVVRIHRAGEAAPYTGIYPAGRDLGPAIPAADKALEVGSVDPLLKLVLDAVREGIREHFQQALAEKNFDKDHVSAGRNYVKAYVEFIHYVERIYEAATKPVHGHMPEPEQAGVHGEGQ